MTSSSLLISAKTVSKQCYILRFWVDMSFSTLSTSFWPQFLLLPQLCTSSFTLVPWVGENSPGRQGERILGRGERMSGGPQRAEIYIVMLYGAFIVVIVVLPHCTLKHSSDVISFTTLSWSPQGHFSPLSTWYLHILWSSLLHLDHLTTFWYSH